jgi:BirA family biotin operon repressor/biotin-[acetyl-CoA-carboxylase] ligase
VSWDPKLFHWHLKARRFGREIVHFEEVDSTNRWMLDNHDRFTLSGGVVVADHQTAGRGRHDRSWVDAPGKSLLFSIVLRQFGGESNLALLSFLPAIALGEYLQESWGQEIHVELKWPNDVLLNGKKISGVLGHTSGSGSSRVIVLGMGVNVEGNADELPDPVGLQASTVEAESGVTIQKEVLLAELLNRMEPLYDDVLGDDLETVGARWLRLGPPLGSIITRTEGASVTTGSFAGLGERGELLLRSESGQIQVLLSGDIEHR